MSLNERERTAVRIWLMDRLATSLDDLVQRGGRYPCECTDGFRASIIAHWGAYCLPRPDLPTGGGFVGDAPWDFNGPYAAIEVGFPSHRPEPWDQWQEFAESPDDPTGTVYARVPVEMVAALLESHGGEL